MAKCREELCESEVKLTIFPGSGRGTPGQPSNKLGSLYLMSFEGHILDDFATLFVILNVVGYIELPMSFSSNISL